MFSAYLFSRSPVLWGRDGRNSVGAHRSRLLSLYLLPSFGSSGSKIGSRAPLFPPLGFPLSSPWVHGGGLSGSSPKADLGLDPPSSESSNCVKLCITSVRWAAIVKPQKMFVTSLPWSNESLEGFKGPKRDHSRNSSRNKDVLGGNLLSVPRQSTVWQLWNK